MTTTTTSAGTVASTNVETTEGSDVESSVQRLHTTKRITKTTPISSTTQSQQQLQQHHDRRITKEYDISIRLATMSDIASISSCNVQTLPENYNDLFYMNHIAEYPYLSLVAVIDEPLDETDCEDTQPQQQRRPIHGNYEPNHHPQSASSSQQQQPTQLNFIQRHLQLSKRRFVTSFWTPHQQYGSYNNNNNHGATTTTSERKSIVVGYLLGKITSPQEPYQYRSYRVNNNLNHRNLFFLNQTNEFSQQPQSSSREMIGHVSSLAILPEARRRGLARALLEQFHFHLDTATATQSSSANQMNHRRGRDTDIDLSCTGLHVRCSNDAAVKLYFTLGYVPGVTIKSYYEDGEDAYYMQKLFGEQEPQYTHREGQTQWQRKSPHMPEEINRFRLPRIISTLAVCENDVHNHGDSIDHDKSKASNDSNDISHSIRERDEEEEDDEQVLLNGTV